MDRGGFEPPTSAVRGRHSFQTELPALEHISADYFSEIKIDWRYLNFADFVLCMVEDLRLPIDSIRRIF